jgi:septum formation protein
VGVTLTPFVEWPADLVLVLASQSPRRAELLQIAGIPFEVVPAGDVEPVEALANNAQRNRPELYTSRLAMAKAEAVARRLPGRLVLGADTIVVHDAEIIEKPLDPEDAFRILRRLSGCRHKVITALALLGGPHQQHWSDYEATTVEFLPLSDAALRRYIATDEPFDKAGAYGIQGFGAMMVRRVEGCYFNVMGLPLALLGEALRSVLAHISVTKPGDGS